MPWPLLLLRPADDEPADERTGEPAERTGELAERAASDDDDDECESDDADGDAAELLVDEPPCCCCCCCCGCCCCSSAPVGDALRRKSDLNFIAAATCTRARNQRSFQPTFR